MIGKRSRIVWQQVRVDVCLQHLPARHSRIHLLVGVQHVVPLFIVLTVIGNQLLPSEIFLVLVEFVGLVADFLILLTPLALAVETTDTLVVLVYHAALLRTVQRLGIFLL